MAKDAIYEGEREVRTFADLNHGADVLLTIAKEQPKGSYYTIMGSLLLSAFTFEAYLNHLGAKLFSYWENLESLPVMDKYAVISQHLKVKPDFGRRPYQSTRNLFRFRNAIAHGKSVILREKKEVSSATEPSDHTPKTQWEEYATLENAERIRGDVSAIVKELHIAAGLGDYPFIHGSTVSGMSLK